MSFGRIAALYGICVVVFFALDFAWLSTATARLYKPMLGDLLSDRCHRLFGRHVELRPPQGEGGIVERGVSPPGPRAIKSTSSATRTKAIPARSWTGR